MQLKTAKQHVKKFKATHNIERKHKHSLKFTPKCAIMTSGYDPELHVVTEDMARWASLTIS